VGSKNRAKIDDSNWEIIVSPPAQIQALPLSLPFLQRYGDNFLVIACNDATVRICRVRPVYGAELAAVSRIGRGLFKLSPADLLVPLWRKFRNNQLATVIVSMNTRSFAWSDPVATRRY
jgi:hypothetical protein